MPIALSALRQRKALRKELLCALAIKLALVYLIKFAFFSHPMDEATVAQAMAGQLLTPPTASAPTHKDSHDQRTTR